ncbi:alpha/beta hydrolase [Archangium lansingense]|uniref:Alpha/beta hydrolase n=1 Tax=Archangium lansingense TaxID=2995310 RepID=A0ABT4ANU7_9BACT|nr:alpha/beta hydrolase [Archangium lansinium]MCY1083372.1 alpha/beta hydrolase [Archangium lansinium]
METTGKNNFPDTIVLIHGLWVTPRSWENWVKFYEARGYKVLAPTYPGMEGEVDGLREDSSPIAELSVQKVVDHYASIIEALPSKPILIGHSFGGTVVQLLLDRGLGAAGVVIDSAPVKGVLRVPLTQVRSTFPVLKNPANVKRAVPFTHEEFHYAFTNTLSEEESREAYERYAVAAPGRILFEGATINLNPNTAAKVDFHKEDRAPLFFIAGEHDHIMPAALNRDNARKYRSGIVAFREFAGRDHFIVGEKGWEEVATAALEWARNPQPVPMQ